MIRFWNGKDEGGNGKNEQMPTDQLFTQLEVTTTNVEKIIKKWGWILW